MWKHPSDDLVVFGDHEQKVIDQMLRCVRAEDGAKGVLAADGHFGYSAPVGANVAYREHVSPATVGYDIGCGNLAVETDVAATDVGDSVPALMDRIFDEVDFGVGQGSGRHSDHEVIEAIAGHEIPVIKQLRVKAAAQLGSVGGGNHYVDLFEASDTGRVWVGVHFGSRGFGHTVATHYLTEAARAAGRDSFKDGQGEMELPPDLLRVDSTLGAEYIEAMQVAGAYARAGREVVVDQVLGILGAHQVAAVHNHHNYAWEEHHGGEEFWVVRKGSTPAFPGQQGFVGATMGEDSVILEGVDSPTSALALYSTVHGAGRAMSRTAAAGKSRKRWACSLRDCDYVQGRGEQSPVTGDKTLVDCPRCGTRVECPRFDGHGSLGRCLLG